jgi:diguanylate cyclase (GGDEF)-like protein
MRSLTYVCCRIALTMLFLSASSRADLAPSAAPELTNASAIRALSASQAKETRLVHVRGIVTFYNPVQQLLFFEDKTGWVYVDIKHPYPLVAGSRVEIWGTTGRGYSTQIEPTEIRETSRGELPRPTLVDFDTASRHENDCRFVALRGIIRSETLERVDDAHLFLFKLEVEKRMVEVAISNYPGFDPSRLLDATVRVDGVVGGRLDLKDQILGLVLHVSNASDITVLKLPAHNLRNIHPTQLDELLLSDRALILSQRIRTRGTLILYNPGERLVIKEGDSILLALTRQEDPMTIGQHIEVTGFATAVNGSPALENAQFVAIGGVTPLPPRDVSFADAMSGLFANDLVALQGEVVSETREDHLDTLILRSGTRVFQAVYHKQTGDADPIPVYQPGTRIRVTGVCIVHVRGFWGVTESFQIHLRSAQDISIVAAPSWFTVRHMLYVISGLLIVAILTLGWGLWMRRRLSAHETLLRHKIESEAARLATLARLERQRSHILELINSFEPLPNVLRAIHNFAAEMWPGVTSYSHILRDRKLHLVSSSPLSASNVARFRVIDPTHSSEACANAVRVRGLITRSLPHCVWSRPIISSQGAILGTMTFEGQPGHPIPLNAEAFEFGCNLAAIAIDNRRLYEDVLHRSQHDQLTGLPNRALLEARLEEALNHGAQSAAAVLFLDLDDFKSVNDTHSHRIGDLYLCEVARRFQACLRDTDTLGRVGGDEFIVVIAHLSTPAKAQIIANRLVQAMHQPFYIEGACLRGTVSIGMAIFPETAASASALKHQADAAMYTAKRAGGDQVSTYTQPTLLTICPEPESQTAARESIAAVD